MSENKPVTLAEIDAFDHEMHIEDSICTLAFLQRLAESYHNLVTAVRDERQYLYSSSKAALESHKRVRAALPEEPEEGAGG